MKRHIPFYLLIVLILSFSGCTTAPNLKKVQDPFTPYDRPSFSIMSPAGDNWSIIEHTDQNSFSIGYLRKPDGQNHSVIATIDEVHDKFNFNSPEEFLLFEKAKLIESYNQPRFYLIEEDIELDNKFGIYCVRFYTLANDFNHKLNNETSRMKVYGYVFLHPNVADLKIAVLYSERGFSDDMLPDFTSAAIKFIEGLKIAHNTGKRYVVIRESDLVYEYGKGKYEVWPGDKLEIISAKTCRGGVGLCWKVRNIKTGDIGYVSADRMKEVHHVYSE